MCLNQEKCTFKVSEGKFPGFKITHQGIEANPDKCTTILEMHNPTNVQEVQKLNGRLASLSRFFPKLTEKTKPFYQLLKKTEPCLWDEGYKQALLASKKTIATPPVLIRPKQGVPLLLYLSIDDEAISLVVVQEEGKHYFPSISPSIYSMMLRNATK